MSTATALPCVPRERTQTWAEDELHWLMSEHEQSLLRFTQSLLRDADLARDCVQDTFLRAYESLCRGKQVNKQWLFKVAYNRSMDEFRLRRWLQPDAEPERLTAPLNAPGETGVIVRQTMDELTRPQREVLYLVAVAGFTADEIAGLLGTSSPSVRQRLYRARREFRRAYAGAIDD